MVLWVAVTVSMLKDAVDSSSDDMDVRLARTMERRSRGLPSSAPSSAADWRRLGGIGMNVREALGIARGAGKERSLLVRFIEDCRRVELDKGLSSGVSSCNPSV